MIVQVDAPRGAPTFTPAERRPVVLARLNSAVLRVVSVVTGLLVTALVLLVGANVFARYALSTGILWSEELSRLLFVWVVFLGAYVALCRGGHVAVVLLVNNVPANVRRMLLLGGLLLVLAFLATIGYAGAGLVWKTYAFGRQTPILGLSASWGYLSVPVACTLMGLRVLQEAHEHYREALRARRQHTESGETPT